MAHTDLQSKARAVFEISTFDDSPQYLNIKEAGGKTRHIEVKADNIYLLKSKNGELHVSIGNRNADSPSLTENNSQANAAK